MTENDVFALSGYRPIDVIDPDHGVCLVRHVTSGRIYTGKFLDIYNAGIYRYLQAHPVPGTPEIIEAVEQDDHLIVVEEYISGRTLRDILDDGNLFTEDDAIGIVIQLCEILTRLHSAVPPILHRDIKPSNIMLLSDGSIRLLDMNAAKWVRTDRTEDTALIGTTGYAAPEQYGFGASDVRTDIYSTGVLLNELITGALPKDRIAEGKPGKIVRKCTLIDPKSRYRDAAALAQDLEACRTGPADLHGIGGQIRKYTPPGFRSGNPTNILTSFLLYPALLYLAANFTADGIRPGLMTTVERLLFLLFGLAVLLFGGNYLEIWKTVGLTRIKNVWLRTLAVLLCMALISFAGLVVMVMIVVIAGE